MRKFGRSWWASRRPGVRRVSRDEVSLSPRYGQKCGEFGRYSQAKRRYILFERSLGGKGDELG